MLEDQGVDALAPDPASALAAPSADDAADSETAHVPGGGMLPAPDPVVADSARLRLAALRAKAAGRPDIVFMAAAFRLISDIRAVGAVLASVGGQVDGQVGGQADGRAGGQVDGRAGGRVDGQAEKVDGRADAMDIGAGLVVLCDLRAHLDHLEAGLLDAAERAGLSWDVVAAIIGIPADEAQRRHRQLRGRRLSP
jgi:hypothetical protein